VTSSQKSRGILLTIMVQTEMAREEGLEVEGIVVEVVKGAFRVKLSVNNSEHVVLAHLGGKMRKNYIKVVLGDRVTVEMSSYDLTRGRITYRH
jgi:translation initiation factor IF-1